MTGSVRSRQHVTRKEPANTPHGTRARVTQGGPDSGSPARASSLEAAGAVSSHLGLRGRAPAERSRKPPGRHGAEEQNGEVDEEQLVPRHARGPRLPALELALEELGQGRLGRRVIGSKGDGMIRVSVHYPSKAGAKFDHAYYAQKHMVLVRQRLGGLGLIRAEIDKGLSAETQGSARRAPP
ncbi:MAG: hypothetical protein DME17_18970 [Candidatus Rokuibacteriota bacterium]|nr:MAG: hypothetical protein DME17_18970 [Candidatus Rokubacteria bacterium]